VFDDVDEVAEHVHLDLAGRRLGADPVELVVGSVDEGDPDPLLAGVALLGLVEDPGEDQWWRRRQRWRSATCPDFRSS
jgi:hypothetical protein